MRTLYNFFFAIGFLLASPYYFMRMRRRGKWRAGFSQRFGNFDTKFKQAITNRHVIWIHAVSVGEVGVCTQLIRAIEPRMPNLKIVVSTTTTTGMEQLRENLPSHISPIYYPIDLFRFVSRALLTVRPEAIVLVEGEIWPNFIWRARTLGIPVFLVNARLSDRSYPRYKLFGFLFRKLFGSFAGVGAQNEADAAKLRELGCRPEAIRVVGSLKYDVAPLDERRVLNVPAILEQIGVPRGARLLVAGSTHPGEETMLGRVFLNLRKQFPDLFLILVPRHFERSREVGNELRALGINFVYRSEITAAREYSPGSVDCLLVNTTGELNPHFYEIATVVYVGKSLAAAVTGGQNPIEPAALGKATVFGPNMQNFADIVQKFVAADAVVQVPDAAGLEQALAKLLSDPARREQLGRNAMRVVQENRGPIDRTVDMIAERLGGSEVYVAKGKWAAR